MSTDSPIPADARIVGILGGMGPLATADLLTKIILNTPATCDQDHVPVVLASLPQMPSRIDAIVSGGPSPLPQMLDSLRLLERAGAGLIAMPCNTAHHWHPALAGHSRLPVLHIVDCTLGELAASERRVGLLGSAGTRRMRLYSEPLRARGLTPLEPAADEQARWVDPAIDDVKAGRLAVAALRLERAALALADRGADVIALACTELPIAMSAVRWGRAARLLDATAALARACVAWHRSGDLDGRAYPASAPELVARVAPDTLVLATG